MASASASSAAAASVAGLAAASAGAASWDPMSSADWDATPLRPAAVTRIRADLASLFKDPAPGICVFPDDNDIGRVHALITGPADTPYEGGVFYFILRCPPDYPFSPPRVKHMTSNQGEVRMHPNLYKNGKVCLSILGTWEGPGWTSSHSIGSVFISIQSLLNEKPYHSEPGFSQERRTGDAKRFNNVIVHETLRVAVLGMARGTACIQAPPKLLQRLVVDSFLAQLDFFKTVCDDHRHLDGRDLEDPFGWNKGRKYQFQALAREMDALADQLDVEGGDDDDDEEDD